MIGKFLKRSNWVDIIISLIFLIFGILLVIRPDATISAVTMILGFIFIVMGILKLIEYYSSKPREDYLLTLSIIEVVIGVIILCASSTVITIIKVILGLWVIINGVLDLQTTLLWRELKSPYWTLTLILSILMILAGIVIITTQDLVIKTIGIILIVYAIIDVIDRIIFMKKIKEFEK